MSPIKPKLTPAQRRKLEALTAKYRRRLATDKTIAEYRAEAAAILRPTRPGALSKRSASKG